MELKRDIVLLILSLPILLLSFFLSYSSPLPLELFLRLDTLLSPSIWLHLILVISLTLIGGYILTYIRDKRLLYGAWLLLISVSLITLLPSDDIDNLAYTSILITSVLAAGREPKGILDIWSRLRAEKSFSTIVLIVLLLWVVLPNKGFYNNMVIDSTLDVVNSFSLTPENTKNIISSIISTELTEEDRRLIREYVQSLPEWNYLTPEQRDEFISRLERELVNQKKLIKESIERSLNLSNVKLDKETLLSIVSSSPQLRSVFESLYIFLLLVALATFSIASEVASLISFLLIVIPEYLRIRKAHSSST